MVNVYDYMDYVTRDKSKEEKIIALLSARGFLFDNQEGKIVLSDNAHLQDLKDLNNILRINEIGFCENMDVKITNPENIVNLYELFSKIEHISYETPNEDTKWRYFKNRIHGKKVPAMELEPFVAKYVKALNACGLETTLSCDSNHKQENLNISIEFNGKPFTLWHSWILENLIPDLATLKWSSDYKQLDFTNTQRFDVYYKLLKSADFLYDNRIYLRELKQKSNEWIKRKDEKVMNNDEIFAIVKKKADGLLDLERLV